MSQRNVEIARSVMDAFNRGDRAAWIALCDPGYENVPSADWPESDPIRGREPAWNFLLRASDTWEDATYKFGDWVDVGDDQLVYEQRAEMKGAASGASVPWTYWVLMTFRGGKVSRTQWFRDRAEALEAAD